MYDIIDEDKFKEIIGQEIARLRKQKGWSQKHLGMVALGYTLLNHGNGQQKICKIENAHQRASILDLHLILTAFGVKFETFIDCCLRLM